jgi:hypothetical protein
MGLFSLFKEKVIQKSESEIVESTVPEKEKKYYKPDSYYTMASYPGTEFESKVITFEERKKTAIPSKRGLYPAEILLLEYCTYGNYPGPKNGYPGLWWFEYGIRDVGAALRSLESRGFIALGSPFESLSGLTLAELKEILSSKGYETKGKKADLIAAISERITEADLIGMGLQQKYHLTELGEEELNENAYVPYMNKTPLKTTEDARFGKTFNVWSVNKLLGKGDKSNWQQIVSGLETDLQKGIKIKHNADMQQLKKIDPKGYEELKAQDDQIEKVNNRRKKYDEDSNIESYIAFWEKLWANGGLLFESNSWYFELPDLYIKVKRYDDALTYVKNLKQSKPAYSEKCDKYIEKIEKHKNK